MYLIDCHGRLKNQVDAHIPVTFKFHCRATLITSIYLNNVSCDIFIVNIIILSSEQIVFRGKIDVS